MNNNKFPHQNPVPRSQRGFNPTPPPSFLVWGPTAARHNVITQPQQAAGYFWCGNKARILLIEDDASMVEAIRLRLEANNYEVLTAQDGREGLNKARSETPDLIILDIMLAKLDGYQVCRMLKFDDKYKHIPIIMLTAKSQEADLQRGKEAGADAYITKPFKAEELLAKIKELLGRPV